MVAVCFWPVDAQATGMSHSHLWRLGGKEQPSHLGSSLYTSCPANVVPGMVQLYWWAGGEVDIAF